MRSGPISWSLSSPDLSPLDVLWWVTKHKVYQSRCFGLTKIIRKISSAVKSKDVDLLQNLSKSSKTQIQTVTTKTGGHFEHPLHAHAIETIRDRKDHWKARYWITSLELFYWLFKVSGMFRTHCNLKLRAEVTKVRYFTMLIIYNHGY